MDRPKRSKLVLETGEVFEGVAFGAKTERVCELVLNTSMVGYQEIITDPTYYKQAVVITYPIIGNYGITDEDNESKSATVGALVVRDYNDIPSNFRCTKTLDEILEDSGIPAIYGVDTRRLTRILRDGGERKCIITDVSTPLEECLKKIEKEEPVLNAVQAVSCRKKWFCRTEHAHYSVVAVDCGIKMSLVRGLCSRGCNVTVVPYNTSAEEIERLSPDGVIISNGPGNPKDVSETVDLIKRIKGKYPILGVGLGMQLIALAHGGKAEKLPFGHRGSNHPVKRVLNGSIEIVTQNHGYVINAASLEGTGLDITHVNVLDGTVEGIVNTRENLVGVQYDSESCPDPKDGYLYSTLISMMEGK